MPQLRKVIIKEKYNRWTILKDLGRCEDNKGRLYTKVLVECNLGMLERKGTNRYIAEEVNPVVVGTKKHLLKEILFMAVKIQDFTIYGKV